MKRITIKSALMRLVAVVLLTIGTISVSAQYYMNVVQKDGVKVQYLVSDIDSVYFSGQQSPAANYEYVDLGLSVKWATFNVGASKPEEYGCYYAWGETEPKTDYSWSTYKWCNGSSSTLTKYNTKSSNGTVDNKTVLDPEDDVAHVKWGGSWRMPTIEELGELRNSCTWTWYSSGNSEFNGVGGYKVTSNKSGYTDRSIFLPAAGYRYDTFLRNVGSDGNYWSSSLLYTDHPGYAWSVNFDSGSHHAGSYGRYYGKSVRPVSSFFIALKLDAESVSLNSGDEITLTAVVEKDGQPVDFSVQWSSNNIGVATVSANGVVKGLSRGTALITAEYSGHKATCQVTVTESVATEYKYVDLGLSVKWATFNVGASKPEGYGDYFAWGETEPYYEAGYYAQENPQAHWKDGKSDGYIWSNYKYCNGSYSTLTKYCNNSIDGNNGFTDTKTTLDPEDDVAHVKWGGDWRMPTHAELDELSNTDNCTWTWTTLNGVKGYLVTSKKSGHEGASIFLPAAGYRDDAGLSLAGEDGNYWSSSLSTGSPYSARGVGFSSGSHYTGNYSRSRGQSVRPVFSSFFVLKLDAEYVSLNSGDEITLTAVVEKDGQPVDFSVQWSSNNIGVATVSPNGVVKGLSRGTALITAEYSGHKATCQVTVTESVATEYKYVDLGLSVKWATFNVGASKPEGYGDYFAWGETEPYYEDGYYAQENPQAHWKEGYTAGYAWSNYKYCNYCNGSYNTMTKYCDNSSYGNNGFTDTKTTLDPEDDVAHVKWGGDWRMPTKDEFTELLNNCTWTWTTLNDVNGYRVTSNKSGYTDRSIFLPAAGYRNGTSLGSVGSYGYYWSSSLFTGDPSYAWNVYFRSGNRTTGSDSRHFGQSVRPVFSSFFVLKLDAESVSLNSGDEITLTAVVEKDGQPVDFEVKWSSNNLGVATVSPNGVVRGLSRGTALITAEYYGHKATCQVTVTESVATEYKYVDLGLSVKWATFNVGASKPEGYGDYFAWGETEPYYEDGYYAQENPQAHWKDGKSDGYTWSNYKYCNGSYNTMTKYCNNSIYVNNGFTDTKTTLDPEDDVAHVKWGGDWRMPTQAELNELSNTDNCTWTWTTLNGVNGYLVTSKKSGHEGASIFLPAAGYRYGTGLGSVGSIGSYWSSSLSTDHPLSDPLSAWGGNFNSGDHDTYYDYRYEGLSVRPVCP